MIPREFLSDAILEDSLVEEPYPQKRTGRSYFLATVRPENLAKLRRESMTYFAVSTLKHKVETNDCFVLYVSKGLPAERAVPGIVGSFVVTESPRREQTEVFGSRFPIRIPWRPVTLVLDNPVPLGPLIPKLASFRSAEHYGPALGRGVKRIWPGDYRVIEPALKLALEREK